MSRSFAVFCYALAMPLLMLLAACGSTTKPSAPVADHGTAERPLTPFRGKYPIRIVTTTGMIADIARNIGGAHVAVEPLMGEGTDPHLYKASPGDVNLLRRADLIFYNGLHLEGKMAEVLERLARRQPTFAVAAKMPAEKLRAAPNQPGAHDPHIWFDVALWSHCAEHARDLLVQFDPPHAAVYQAQAAVYLKRLAELDRFAREQIATIPRERRVLVTAHDAFGYFGRAYDIEVLAIQGISTESEAGVQKINTLVQTLVSRGIKAVFVESSVSDKNMQALVEGCAARGHQIRIGGSLYSDAMGRTGTPDGTYEGMVRHNVETIVTALH